MKRVFKQETTRVFRTYRGGYMLERFLGADVASDSFKPEDWISSFVEAKNKNYVEGEGLSRLADSDSFLIDAVPSDAFGDGRTDSGVLIKLLDSAERLGIQVHPTKDYARRIFNSAYGKTECWYILDTREVDGEAACVYIGFKEGITKEKWRELFMSQDIKGMLDCLHKIDVKIGDCILVEGGTPHAIGGGCFLLEIQEPSDYTMRVEKVTVAGDTLTPMQIHYGVGEDNMLDCFNYVGESYADLTKRVMPEKKIDSNGIAELVGYENTDCFKLERVDGGRHSMCYDGALTLVSVADTGSLICEDKKIDLKRGDRFFVCANTDITLDGAAVLICYPPKKK